MFLQYIIKTHGNYKIFLIQVDINMKNWTEMFFII